MVTEKPEELAVDTVVIGAGVVGLAVARVLAQRGQVVIVLEASDRFGEGLSSRNSEVIHAGIYYPEGSLKARLCVAGRRSLYDYCGRRGIGHRKCGKWIVGVGEEQAGRLELIRQQARRNGVELSWAGRGRLLRALPSVSAAAALYSPETGIVDSHQLMLALLADLETAGGQLICRAPILAARSDGAGHLLDVGGDMPCRVRAARVVNAAGLDAVPLARGWQGYDVACCPPLFYARGVYFSYGGRHPFRELVYPVPEPGGLGVHLTLDMAGQARFGPDVEWIDGPDYIVDPGRVTAFARAISQWWPALDPARLQPAYAGVRPKLSGPGEAAADFMIQDASVHQLPGLVHLFGIESPGLTACLAIADHVAELLG